jgi:DNA polymerase V
MSGCAGSDPYALRVLGDSMAPEFTDGEVIVIEPGSSCEAGSYVIALFEDEYVFRMLSINDNQLYLRPLNDVYSTIKIDDKSQIKGRIISKSSGKGRQIKSYL